MSYTKPGTGNKTQRKHGIARRNAHIPSVREVFGFPWYPYAGRSSGSSVVADYVFLPTSETIHKPIKDTSRLARLWANGKIKTETSED